MWYTTCDKIMAELKNWIYDEASDQKIRDLWDSKHQVTQTMPIISSQTMTNYKQYYVVHLVKDNPTIEKFIQTVIGGIITYHSLNIDYPNEVLSTPPFFWQESS